MIIDVGRPRAPRSAHTGSTDCASVAAGVPQLPWPGADAPRHETPGRGRTRRQHTDGLNRHRPPVCPEPEARREQHRDRSAVPVGPRRRPLDRPNHRPLPQEAAMTTPSDPNTATAVIILLPIACVAGVGLAAIFWSGIRYRIWRRAQFRQISADVREIVRHRK